jgi:hypothetical protein
MSKAKRFFTQEIVPQRVRTTDAILSTPTSAELEANQRHTSSTTGLDLGKRWTGDLKPVGEAVARVIDALRRVKDRARQKDALSEAVVAIENFGNDLGTSEASSGPAGSLAFNGGAKPEFSRASVGDSGGAQLRKWRDQTSNEVASINAKNREYYGQKPLP